MPIDDITGGIVNAIGRFIGHIIIDILLEIVFTDYEINV